VAGNQVLPDFRERQAIDLEHLHLRGFPLQHADATSPQAQRQTFTVCFSDGNGILCGIGTCCARKSANADVNRPIAAGHRMEAG